MPLQVTDLSTQELTALANCNFAVSYIGIRRNGAAHEIVTIAKNDITCWQLFLRFFGLGRLQRTQFHLQTISAYLNNYSWRTLANDFDPTSEQYKAYLTVCTLANKTLLAKKNSNLFDNVSSGNLQIRLQINFGYLFCLTEDGFMSFYTNPKMQFKHLQQLLCMQGYSSPKFHSSFNINTDTPISTKEIQDAIQADKVFIVANHDSSVTKVLPKHRAVVVVPELPPPYEEPQPPHIVPNE